MIEKGRHQDINKENRYCPFCPGIVEDEKHFLFKCKTYEPFRCELLNEVENYRPWRLENINFIALVNDNSYLTSKFICKSLELRQFLMARHKVNDWIGENCILFQLFTVFTVNILVNILFVPVMGDSFTRIKW